MTTYCKTKRLSGDIPSRVFSILFHLGAVGYLDLVKGKRGIFMLAPFVACGVFLANGRSRHIPPQTDPTVGLLRNMPRSSSFA